jgi:integrase
MHELRKTVEVMEDRGDYSSQEVTQRFRLRKQGQQFCAYVLAKAGDLKQKECFGTAHVCKYAANSFLKFLGGKDIRIDKISASLMEEYEKYLLLKGRSKNTVSCYMRSLRAAYNRAVREKVFVVKKTGDKPFSGVFTGNAKTRKRAVSKECIAKMVKVEEATEINEATEKKETSIHSLPFCRDLFLFSFYTQGMSFSDMAHLKKENIRDGFIHYHRKKTGQEICIEMEECMKEIIERYADSSPEFLFPVLKELKDPEASKDSREYEKWKKTGHALSAYNKNLKKLAALSGIEEHLTSYVARHSWASIASQEGIPLATISRGMGHESEKTTRIYISQTDYSDVGRANRQILSRVFR